MLQLLPAPAPVYKAQPKPEQWRAIRHVAETRERSMARAVRDAFTDLIASIQPDRLLQACESKRVQAVIDEIPFGTLQAGFIHAAAIVNDALVAGGNIAGAQLIDQLFPVQKASASASAGKSKLDLRFDLTNPAAVKWASNNSARMITQVSADTQKGVQALVVRAFEQGIPPRDLARMIREQGIGLTAPQAIALGNFRAGLVTAGLKAERIQVLTQRKYAQQITHRSMVIARHELLQASNRGQSLLWSESTSAGLIPDTTKRKWIITPDDRLCPICAQMTGDRAVTGLTESWSTPNGSVDIPQQIHIMCRCAQGLAINLNVARAQAEAAIANPSPQLQALMPKLVEPPSATLPPGLMTPKPKTLTEGQLQTIWQLASSGKATIPKIAAGMDLDQKVVANAYRLMSERQKVVLAELKGKWPIDHGIERSMGAKYPDDVDRHYAGWAKRLTRDEGDAIHGFTGSEYIDLNRELRAGADIAKDYRASLIQAAIAKAPKPPPPELVWRGVSGWPDEFKDGDVRKFSGFQSTTISPLFAKGWNNRYLLEIKPSRGAYINRISMHKTEYEYLLPHNAEYKIVGRRTVKFRGRYRETYEVDVIQVEQLP